ncbi:hypothetical protein WJX75_002471 [Coccomyxa subellipsoidea]|uniref:Uncharacterized protein n=1 Tax=Coccomyxa subellipsoidea TaxID=248742 RepID=A0ABR2YYK7_9CHLO
MRLAQQKMHDFFFIYEQRSTFLKARARRLDRGMLMEISGRFCWCLTRKHSISPDRGTIGVGKLRLFRI